MPLMRLPTIHTSAASTDADLLRLFQQTDGRWAAQVAQATALSCGTAYANRELADVYDANHVREAALPEGATAEEALEEVEAHYAAIGTRCAFWVMNPLAPTQRTAPLVRLLMHRGYRAQQVDLMVLERAARVSAPAPPSLMVIPARSSFRHTRRLFEEATRRWNTPQLVDACMLRLDDPHYDALLALSEGRPAAFIGVLVVGDVGRIEDVYVMEEFRRRGVGRLMLGRAIELCGRAMLRRVMLEVAQDNVAARSLYAGAGFRVFGAATGYRAPWTSG